MGLGDAACVPSGRRPLTSSQGGCPRPAAGSQGQPRHPVCKGDGGWRGPPTIQAHPHALPVSHDLVQPPRRVWPPHGSHVLAVGGHPGGSAGERGGGSPAGLSVAERLRRRALMGSCEPHAPDSEARTSSLLQQRQPLQPEVSVGRDGKPRGLEVGALRSVVNELLPLNPAPTRGKNSQRDVLCFLLQSEICESHPYV